MVQEMWRLLIALVLLHSGLSLKCYDCQAGLNDTTCDKVSEKMPLAFCGNPTGRNIEVLCLTKIIREQNLLNVTRSCIHVNGDECKAPKGVDLLYCSTCYADYCNTAALSGSSHLKYCYWAILMAFLIVKL